MGLLTDLRTFLQRVQSRRIRLLPDASAVDLRGMRSVAAQSKYRCDRFYLYRSEQLPIDLALCIQAEFGGIPPIDLIVLVQAGLSDISHEHLQMAMPREARWPDDAMDKADTRLFELADT